MTSEPVAIVVPTYNGVNRLKFFLETVEKHDSRAFDVPWLIVEDPCGQEEVSNRYDSLCDRFSLPIYHLDTWSNMHGAARKAFDLAFDLYNPDWTLYLGDDLACTPGALSNMIHFVTKNPLQSVSLVGFPYWNSHDFCKFEDSEWDGPKFFRKKEDFYESQEWVAKVPRNPHWDGPSPHVARPYINVNGVGFAARSAHYRAVGGFAQHTWCLDESLSVRTWANSDQSIVCLPGPPLVHYFGASTIGHHTSTNAHTEEVWIEEMGMSKREAGELSYASMFAREAAVKEEMAGASYWPTDARRIDADTELCKEVYGR